MEEIDATNVLSFRLAKLVPHRIKKYLRYQYNNLQPFFARFIDPLDGFFWLSLNPRYRVKYLIYSKRRDRILNKLGSNTQITRKTKSCEPYFYGSNTRQKVMTVIPYWEKGLDDFCSGDFFTEIYLSARERFGPDNAAKLTGLSETNWIESAKLQVMGFNPTYLIMDVEQDPVSSKWWSLDVFFTSLRMSGWGGRIVLISYDSVWDSTKFHIDRITRSVDNVTVITIDRPYQRKTNKSVSYFGPVILPLSRGSLTILQSLRNKLQNTNMNITFIGSLYGYRRKLLDGLSFEAKSKMLINPQGNGVEYFRYLQELGTSMSTMNFSRASGKNLNQFKYRVVESALLGCVVITDGKKLLNQFFPEFKVIGFKGMGQLEKQILDNSELVHLRSEVNSEEYFSKIEDLVLNSFWDQVVR